MNILLIRNSACHCLPSTVVSSVSEKRLYNPQLHIFSITEPMKPSLVSHQYVSHGSSPTEVSMHQQAKLEVIHWSNIRNMVPHILFNKSCKTQILSPADL